MRKLGLILMVLALVLPMAALADTPYANEALGLELSVPDGWMITNAGGGDMILNPSTNSMVMLMAESTPGAKLALSIMSEEMVAPMLTSMLGNQGIQVDSTINTGGENPLFAVAFTNTDPDAPGSGVLCLYAPADDVLAIALAIVPAESASDITWFTSAMEAKFPELAAEEE